MVSEFLRKGWITFDTDAVIQDWLKTACPAAEDALRDPDLSHWYDCENTWFVGVDALPNDVAGKIAGGTDLLQSKWAAFLTEHFSGVPELHKGQLSVVWPGYPRPRMGEGEKAFKYREIRHGAHVDGILPMGKERRRMVKEPHAFVVGMPLNDSPENVAPLKVWEGSHIIMRKAFEKRLRLHPPSTWKDVDITDAYQSARKEVFESCPVIDVTASPGEAYLLHRHTVHGIGPWPVGVNGPQDGRQVAYFRPEFPGGVFEWLTAP